MDIFHPSIVQAVAAHESPSPLYARLAENAMDVNELCLRFRSDIERMGLALARVMLDIQEHEEAGNITAAQRERLKAILNDGLEDPTPPSIALAQPDAA